ncbi:CLASSICAL ARABINOGALACTAN PROTEIN 25 [Salix viminalis]|uniref:CLASSICAL ARABINOGALACTAN PROTEIN 25 n=1 Tax=Salix viminalis TaxID=40686 RepID=A0A9Q0Z592_SALVM|nr:CLASSICAL ARABINOGALACTAN PROTEIN 25 [Salix viminalis]
MICYPLLSSSTQLNSKTSNYPISTSPAILANPPSPSPVQELPPDVAPLLPSPGGVLPSPTVSSVPTIPSTPSPPDPDGVVAPGPGSAFSPLGPLPASSASPRNLINFAVAAGFIAYWSV